MAVRNLVSSALKAKFIYVPKMKKGILEGFLFSEMTSDAFYIIYMLLFAFY